MNQEPRIFDFISELRDPSQTELEEYGTYLLSRVAEREDDFWSSLDNGTRLFHWKRVPELRTLGTELWERFIGEVLRVAPEQLETFHDVKEYASMLEAYKSCIEIEDWKNSLVQVFWERQITLHRGYPECFYDDERENLAVSLAMEAGSRNTDLTTIESAVIALWLMGIASVGFGMLRHLTHACFHEGDFSNARKAAQSGRLADPRFEGEMRVAELLCIFRMDDLAAAPTALSCVLEHPEILALPSAFPDEVRLQCVEWLARNSVSGANALAEVWGIEL